MADQTHGLQVAGLFSFEELESTLAPLKEKMASQALLGQDLYTFFTSQVQRHLRIVISMDPGKPSFAPSCQANPALFSRCDWLASCVTTMLQCLFYIISVSCLYQQAADLSNFTLP